MHNQKFVGNIIVPQDGDDKSSLEAAAEAAAKVNAMLIAKGMLKPNQLNPNIDSVITKKIGGPNNLVVAEVEINCLPPPCRNTLTRGSTQEEISKASGAAVTTRGRFMADNERARNSRDRCLYLNVQAAKKESVDIAVQKINDIIRSMGGGNLDAKGIGNQGFQRGGRFRPPRTHGNQNRFGHPHPPPLMSLHTPPPQAQQLPTPIPQPQLHLPPPPPQTVTIMQEKLYVGLEHAPPNFDTKNKLLGPGGSYLHHIQAETVAAVSLRGKGSGFMDLNGADAFEPMHIHIEHPSLISLQEAKKLAENLIQTVQQSYVSFQQALAAMPPSMPTGLFTGVPQQHNLMETQLAVVQAGLTPIATVQEQPMQSMPPQGQPMGPPPVLVATCSLPNQISAVPQAMTNTVSGHHTVVIPSSMGLNQVPVVNTLPVSAPPSIMQQQAPLDLGGQQAMLLSQQPPPQAMGSVGLQQVVQPSVQPPPVATPLPPYASMQPAMQLVSQPVSMAPPAWNPPQPGPPLFAQAPPHAAQTLFPPQQPPVQNLGLSIPAHSSVVYTVASSSHPYFSTPKEIEEPKRRFTEEKDDKIPENLLGYQHGPPHLVNLLRSSPPPQPVPPPMSQAVSQAHSMTQLFQAPPPQAPHGLIMNHISPEQAQFNHMGGQTLVAAPNQTPIIAASVAEGQQLMTQAPPSIQSGLPPFMSGPPLPPHIISHLPPPSSRSPGHHPSSSPGSEVRPQSRNSSSPTTLMPPPHLPTTVSSPSKEEKREKESRSSASSKSSSEGGWEHGGKRKGMNIHNESDKKKTKGVLKNRQGKQHEAKSEDKNASKLLEENESQEDDKRHPASPQYQGQPLRYPNMPSDPNIPPQLQEMGVPRLPQPGLNPNLLPGHALVQQGDIPPQGHPPHPHMHLEAPRPEGVPPPPNIMIEHPMPHGAPMPMPTHHRPLAPGQIHIEQQVPPGALPRQLLIDHPSSQVAHLEQQGQPPQLHAEHLPPQPHPGPPQTLSVSSHPPPHQEMFEFELGATQQVPPPHPQFQNFEHVPVAVSQHEEQQQQQQQAQSLLPPGSAVIVSSTQHYPPQYSVAISSQNNPPVTFAIPSSGGIPVYSQSIHLQRMPEPQVMSVPPPMAPPPPFSNIGVPPTSSPHLQAHYAHPQPVQGQVIHQPPPTPVPSPVVSQPPQYQNPPQGVPFWVSQA